MNHEDRRRAARVPVGLYVNQLVGDQEHRCFTSSLSATGLFLERVVGPWSRHSTEVQLELPLPGLAEPLWACGEVVYDSFDELFHGSAVTFTRMPDKHRAILRSWLHGARAAMHVAPPRGRVQIVRPS